MGLALVAGARETADPPAGYRDPGVMQMEYYVSIEGDDNGPGQRDTPWKTIARALRAAGPGVVVNLMDGTYGESVVIDKGGGDGAAFMLRSAPGQHGILDGQFALDIGVSIRAAYVAVQGLEIRNYKVEGVYARGPGAHHVLIERNVIHHISSFLAGEGDASRGIRTVAVSDCTIRRNTISWIIGNKECFGIFFDYRSALGVALQDTVIEQNLLYFIDKAGIRLVDNTAPESDRRYALATPPLIRRNISVHNAYVGIEVNYVNSFVVEGEGPLGTKRGAPVYVEDNFVGWCGSFGMNPKQTHDGITRHNTIVGTHGWGYLQSGKPSMRMRIEGNLLVDNTVGSMIHTEGEDNQFIGNFYRQKAPWLDFFWDRTRGWATPHTDLADLRANSRHHPEQKGDVDNDARLFRNPVRGDYRLLPDSTARQSAPDGDDFGAREAALVEVGASGRYGLANVPRIPEITGLKVISASSEDPLARTDEAVYSTMSTSADLKEITTGRARHMVDGALCTAWRPANGETTGWVELEIPGDASVALGAFMILANRSSNNEYKRHAREFRLSVRSSSDDPWQLVRAYTRYMREEGRVFPIPGAPKAGQVRIDVLSNHGGPILEICEFRLYGAFEPFE